MRVGFWLDWNGPVEDELYLHTSTLALALDREITPVEIKHWAKIPSFDGDLLTFDYGGIAGGYGPNPIVPAMIDGVRKWCERNPDRLALVWCTFEPDWYRDDFQNNGGLPCNLRFYHRLTAHVLERELRERYPQQSK